jgi:hypothetical protein
MALQTSVEYRYFLTDLLTNSVISEIPFKGVSYQRVNRRAGEFSGDIPFIAATKGLDIYEATMPGRTGLYVMRNQVCVWGGILWSRTYNVESKTLSVSASEFTSYFYHRNLWQTLQYGSEFVGISSFAVSSGTGTITTEVPHGFVVGQKVKITFTSPLVDGVQTVTAVPATNQYLFTTTSANGSGLSTSGACRSLVDTFDFARDLVYRVATDLGGINFANEVIKPAKELQGSVISKRRSAGLVTLRTSSPHEAIPGQEIEVVEVGSGLDGLHVITEVPDSSTVVYSLSGADLSETSISGIRSLNVTRKKLVDNLATITLDRPHGASVGQTVILEGVDAFYTKKLDSTFNGRFTITGIPSATEFTFISGGILNVIDPATGNGLVVAGGIATFGSKFIYGDFGSFTSNSDIGILFENLARSGEYQDTQIFRGFEQRSVGEVLETYSNIVKGGFEYRIDCDYDFDTAQFTRTFRILPIERSQSPLGFVYTAEELGADQIVFEYPGNISTFSVEESAEDAATRFFVVGNIEDLSDAASQPYAGASAKDLLNNTSGRSWPLLDQVETLDKVQDEITLYNYAEDYLYESRPPIGKYSITVNGSLAPIIGSYFPGDWCSIIIDDDYVRERLANDQEPRDDLLIRKINSYTVSVPDSPTFPESVQLELITDWKVDKRVDA